MYKNNSSEAWREAMLLPSANIKEAIQNLNKVSVQIVLVVDEQNRLIGTLSDGDIRRALLRGFKLEDGIDSIINRAPILAPLGMSRDIVLELMQINRVHQIPIVGDGNMILGLYLWDELKEVPSRDNMLVIMAGGKGARLLPYTETCPKPMLKIGDKPMLEHIVNRAKSRGFTNIVIAINYLGHVIEEYFESGAAFGVSIRYLKEEKPLGTAGALSILKEIPTKPFIVTNGDILTDICYGEALDYHLLNNAEATMSVRAHEWQNPYGVVELNGIEITGFQEKPVIQSYVNAGIYVLSPSTLTFLNKGEWCDMPSLFERLQEAKIRTIAYPMHETWLDVGRPEDLLMANSKSLN